MECNIKEIECKYWDGVECILLYCPLENLENNRKEVINMNIPKIKEIEKKAKKDLTPLDKFIIDFEPGPADVRKWRNALKRVLESQK